MDNEELFKDVFETGMINGVYYADKYTSVYHAFCYFSQSGLQEKDMIRLYKIGSYPGICNIPRIIGLWMVETKRNFAKLLYSEINTLEDMLIFCIPIYHPDLVIAINKNREEVINDWFAEHLTMANAIEHFDELKSIFTQLNFEYKKKYPGYIETLCLSFVNETADSNFMYQVAQNIQDRILEKGFIEFDDVKEIRDNGIPYKWFGPLMERLDEANLELFIKACINTFDENIVTEYMKYFYATENEEMIQLLLERSYEIKEKDVMAFTNVKKYEMDFLFYDVVIDNSEESTGIVDKFDYKGTHIMRYPNKPDAGTNPFDNFMKEGKWILVTGGNTNLDTFEMNISLNPNTEITIWVIDNMQFVPKYMNIQYVIGSDMECVNQIKRIMGIKI